MRKTEFADGEYYHIFNRGVDKREIFLNVKDYDRFLLAMDLLNNEEDELMIEWRDYKKTNPKANLEDFLKPGFRKDLTKTECMIFCWPKK